MLPGSVRRGASGAAEYGGLKGKPAETKDGQQVALRVNAGLAEDAAMLEASGADGIGLFRTEFQFLVAAELPGRESQQRLYKSVLDAAGDRPVGFRPVDIGGDKAPPYPRRGGGWEGGNNVGNLGFPRPLGTLYYSSKRPLEGFLKGWSGWYWPPPSGP